MFFESRSLWHPKDTNHASEYEDAYHVGKSGVVAVADGVSQGIFCRQWANLLVTEVCANPPSGCGDDQILTWLQPLREKWRDAIDFGSLSWFQRKKLQEVGGAYSTLLWAQVEAVPLADPDTANQFRLVAQAIGDCCMFVIRAGELVRKFPLNTTEDFEQSPQTFCSIHRATDPAYPLSSCEEICQDGDYVFLCSDALAKWIYQSLEAQRSVDWNQFWSMSDDEWRNFVVNMRAAPEGDRMRVDDTTLVMLRLDGSYCPTDDVSSGAESNDQTVPDLPEEQSPEPGPTASKSLGEAEASAEPSLETTPASGTPDVDCPEIAAPVPIDLTAPEMPDRSTESPESPSRNLSDYFHGVLRDVDDFFRRSR